jgi:hypothetical protein
MLLCLMWTPTLDFVQVSAGQSGDARVFQEERKQEPLFKQAATSDETLKRSILTLVFSISGVLICRVVGRKTKNW